MELRKLEVLQAVSVYLSVCLCVLYCCCVLCADDRHGATKSGGDAGCVPCLSVCLSMYNILLVCAVCRR